MHAKIIISYSHRIAKALNSCNASTSDIVSTTERLKQELEVTTQRQEIVSCFLRDYQLSSDEVQIISLKLHSILILAMWVNSNSLVFIFILQSGPFQINALRDEDLNEDFFKALSHVQEIHANCKILLRTHHQAFPLSPLCMRTRVCLHLLLPFSLCTCHVHVYCYVLCFIGCMYMWGFSMHRLVWFWVVNFQSSILRRSF